ncbi:MAG TPA: lipoprotein-releasing ABC transporter permease subunit [Cellvibrionaceae bacterium]
MFNRFSLMLGRRYALSRDSSHLVSFISRMSVLGLVIGVALLLLVMSIMNGFDRELRERILRILPQATLYHNEGIDNAPALIATLTQHPQVISASAFVKLQGLLSRGREVAPVAVLGIDVAAEAENQALASFLEKGDLSVLADQSRALIIGRALANSLGAASGDRLTLVIPRRSDNRNTPDLAIFEVVDIFDSGTEIDNNLALTNLGAAAELSAHPGRASGVRLQLDDLFRAQQTVYELNASLPYGYYSTDWTRTHGNLYQAIHMSKRLVGLLLLLLIGIAAFNLVSTLIMVVVDKQGDIAILRTQGASSAEIIGIFLVQGGLIGAIGTAAGLLLGIVLSLSITPAVAALEQWLDVKFLASDVYPVSYLPAQLLWQDVLYIGVSALLLSLFASLYPAWRAARVLPAEALRYE